MECDDKFIDKQHTSTTIANGRRLLIHALLKCYTKLTALAISLYKKNKQFTTTTVPEVKNPAVKAHRNFRKCKHYNCFTGQDTGLRKYIHTFTTLLRRETSLFH